MTIPRAQRSWSKKAPEDRDWDAIVIGSGIGGMATASLLAKLGKTVLVLEQHYVPGGYTHAFTRKGFEWDVGVHLVGETTEHSLVGRALRELTNGELQWEPIGDVYDSFWFPDGVKVDFANNPRDFVERLVEVFPDERDTIERYLVAVREAVKAMRGYYLAKALPGAIGRALGGWVSRDAQRMLSTTAEDVMRDLVPNEKLRAVLLGQWGYHGSPPSEVAWALQALIVRHFSYGAYYPVGGAKQIARHMLRTVAEAGGWTRICADVDEILVEKGRAVGVRLVDGEEIRAKRVVSAAGAWGTVTKLLPREHRDDAWAARIAKHAPAPAHLCLYLGFEGDIEAAGATRASQWIYKTWDHSVAGWDIHPDEEPGPPPIVFTSYPSLKDPSYDPGPKQKHTGEVITFVSWEAFQRWEGTAWRKRGDDYLAFKERLTEQLLDTIFEHNPELRKLLVHHELGTPLSSDTFSRPYHGSIYGLNHSPERFADPWLRPQSPIPGLFLSGSDVSSCGVMGAFMGGLLCGIAMEPVKGVRWMNGIVSSGR